MREERPTILDLICAVRDFLDQQVRPELNGRLAFHTRVAANALGIVARELSQGEDLEIEERQGLEAILGPSAGGSEDATVSELNRELCGRIRSGELDPRDAELLAHLRRTIDRKLAIDNPKYRPVAEVQPIEADVREHGDLSES